LKQQHAGQYTNRKFFILVILRGLVQLQTIKNRRRYRQPVTGSYSLFEHYEFQAKPLILVYFFIVHPQIAVLRNFGLIFGRFHYKKQAKTKKSVSFAETGQNLFVHLLTHSTLEQSS